MPKEIKTKVQEIKGRVRMVMLAGWPGAAGRGDAAGGRRGGGGEAGGTAGAGGGGRESTRAVRPFCAATVPTKFSIAFSMIVRCKRACLV